MSLSISAGWWVSTDRFESSFVTKDVFLLQVLMTVIGQFGNPRLGANQKSFHFQLFSVLRSFGKEWHTFQVVSSRTICEHPQIWVPREAVVELWCTPYTCVLIQRLPSFESYVFFLDAIAPSPVGWLLTLSDFYSVGVNRKKICCQHSL